MKSPIIHFPGGGTLPFSAELLARAVAIKAEILATPGADLLPAFDVWQAVHDRLTEKPAQGGL